MIHKKIKAQCLQLKILLQVELIEVNVRKQLQFNRLKCSLYMSSFGLSNRTIPSRAFSQNIHKKSEIHFLLNGLRQNS